MQLFAYRNTMANARFKVPPQDEFVRRTAAQMREARRAANRKALLQSESYQIFLRQKAEADDAIRRANERLREFRWATACLETVMRRICKATNVMPQQVISESRATHVVFARQAIFYWSRRLSALSYPQIGREIGNRDHTTVLHGVALYPMKRSKQGRTLKVLVESRKQRSVEQFSRARYRLEKIGE